MIYEIKKMFYHQKGFIFVMLFIIASTCMLFMSDKPFDSAVEDDLKQYKTYINQIEGHTSKETELFLTNESKSINEARISLDKLYDQYYNGEIEEIEFSNERNRLETILENQNGFELVYEQYLYVRENSENRYFLYRNGWDGLLSNEGLDFLLILTILLLTVPVFCNEYESSMDSLSLTMKKGGRREAICKVSLVLLTVLLLGLLSFGLRYMFFDIKYGLNNGSFPLQSLTYFSTATKDISLIGAFFCISAMKILGYLSFATIVLFLSVCIKKYALTLFSSTALIIVPFLGFGNSFAKYMLSGSLGLMLGTGFFRGSVYKTDRLTDEVIQIFQEIPVKGIVTLVCVMLFVILTMIFILMYLRSNMWIIKRSSRKHSALSIMLIFCLLIPSLTGCTNDKTNQDRTAYNLHQSMSYENENYKCYVDETDLDNRHLVVEDKKTGAIQDLVRTPLQSSFQVVDAVYGNGHYLYYIKQSLNKSELKEYIDRVSIVEVDTRTFSERIIYEKNVEFDGEWFMGTVPFNNDDLLFLHVASAFFIDDDRGYAYVAADDIYQIDLLSGKISKLNIPLNSNVAFDGERIYYIGNRYQLSYYDTIKSEYGTIADTITTKFFLTDNELFFLNRLDGKKLYSMNLKTSLSKKVLDKTALDFHCVENILYYKDIDDLQEYSVELN